MAAGAHRRSRRMREGGKMGGAAGADLLKPQHEIRGLVKPRAAESTVKSTNAYSMEEPWIYVRGCPLKRVGLRFNSQGEVYVPDSEDEEEALEVSVNGPVGVHLAPAVAADGAAGADLAPAMAADGAAAVDLATAVGADRKTSVYMKPEVAARLAKKVLGEDLHPELAALLAEVLPRWNLSTTNASSTCIRMGIRLSRMVSIWPNGLSLR